MVISNKKKIVFVTRDPVMVFAYLRGEFGFSKNFRGWPPLISVRLASSMEICSRRVVSRSSHLACIQRCNFFSEKKEDSKSYRYRDVTLFYPIHWGKIVLGLIFCHFLLWFFRLGFFHRGVRCRKYFSMVGQLRKFFEKPNSPRRYANTITSDKNNFFFEMTT